MTVALRPPTRLGPTSPSAHRSPILIVDDHRPNLLALEAVLAPLGEPLESATSGAEALSLLEVRDYAVALLDVRMPGLSGLDVAARLRARGIHTPIIFLSAAQEDAEVKADGYDRGAVDFLTKPFDPSVLRAKVRTFLQLYAQRRELERLSASHEAQRLIARQRVQILANVSVRLSRWIDAENVAKIAVSEAHDALRASASAVYLLSEGGRELSFGAARGGQSEWLPASPQLSLDTPLPVTLAVRTGEPVWLENRQALLRAYPNLAATKVTEAVVALPFRAGDRSLGALAFSFEEPKTWDTAEQEFLLTLTAQFAAALERARLIGLERRAHQALEQRTEAMRFLADVGALLSSSLDYEAVLRRLTERVVPALADYSAVDVLGSDGRIERLFAYHSDPEKLALALELERRYPMDAEAAQGVPNVLRTGESEWVEHMPDALIEARARDPEHHGLLRKLGIGSYVTVPLTARGRTLGALSLAYAESRRRYGAEDVRFVEQLAARAALSVDNARLFQEQVEARERLERQSRHALLAGDVGNALTRSTLPSEALQRCTEAVVRHVGAALARIWTLDTSATVLEPRASAGMSAQLDGPHGRIAVGHHEVGRIARDGTPHWTNDVQRDPALGDPEWARREGMVSFAGYPLIIEGKVIGVMALFARHPLTDDTFAALASVADTVAIGIERGRAEQRAREERDTLEVVNEVGRALAAELDRDRLVQAIIDFGTKLAGAAFGAFYYDVDASGEAYTQRAISGAAEDAFARFPAPRNTPVFAPGAGQSIVRLDDIRRDPGDGRGVIARGLPAGDGSVASYLAVPVVSRTGNVIGQLFFWHPSAAVFRERSEMLVAGVAAQAAIAMDNARLFREAEVLIAELDKSNRELDQFAYVASHDLKAPLRGISNLSTWLEEDLGEAVTPEGKQQLELLRNRVQRMEGLINGILDYSRAGRVRARAERVAVDQLLAEVVELCAPPAAARIEVQPGMPELHTERVPLQQVFMNLIGNALKHAKRSDPRVRIAVKTVGGWFEFTVSDDGPGIAPEYHERIWGLFQTLEPRDTVEGTGIGLSVVKKIVENKGGRVWVESREGEGATFGFTWPRSETEVVSSG